MNINKVRLIIKITKEIEIVKKEGYTEFSKGFLAGMEHVRDLIACYR